MEKLLSNTCIKRLNPTCAPFFSGQNHSRPWWTPCFIVGYHSYSIKSPLMSTISPSKTTIIFVSNPFFWWLNPHFCCSNDHVWRLKVTILAGEMMLNPPFCLVKSTIFHGWKTTIVAGDIHRLTKFSSLSEWWFFEVNHRSWPHVPWIIVNSYYR